MLFLSGNPDLRDTQGESHGNDAMGSTLHWGPYWPVNGYEKTTKEQWVSLLRLVSGKQRIFEQRLERMSLFAETDLVAK